jgi:hypothetical protein
MPKLCRNAETFSAFRHFGNFGNFGISAGFGISAFRHFGINKGVSTFGTGQMNFGKQP